VKTRTTIAVGGLLVAAAIAGGCAGKQAAPPVDPGVEMFEAGEYESARAHYEGKLAENPADLDATIYLGRIALRQEDLDGAIEWMEKGLELAPDSAKTHYWAATAYVVKVQKQQDIALVSEVKSHIEKAVELDPNYVDARLFLAGFLMNAPPFVGGDMEKAREQAAILVEQAPFRGNMFLAELHKKENNFDKASEAYAAAAVADPASADPWHALGIMYQNNKEWDKAFEAFEKAIATDPKSTQSLYQIGRTGVFSEQNTDRAIEALRQYLAIEPAEGQPTWANARWRLGLLYEIKGDVAAARAEYNAALELNPDDENVQKELNRLDEAETEAEAEAEQENG
jgi:tetratricopeptide (TPR) repeat protein